MLTSRRIRWLLLGALSSVSALTSGCGSSGKFVWYSEIPRNQWSGPSPSSYVIGVGDVINVSVYGQENLSTKAKVRSDGRIAMTLLGEVVAVGKRPLALAQEFELRLKALVVSPRVTVNVEESRPISVTLLGEVGHGGTITLERPAAILQAMAQAGGLSEFADDSRIFLLRQQPGFQRIRFTYEAIVTNKNGAATFPLQNGDVILVE